VHDAKQILKLGVAICLWLVLLVPLRNGLHVGAEYLATNVGIWAGVLGLVLGFALMLTYLAAPVLFYLKVNYGDEREF
jgi:hypothetical protein